MSPNKAILQWSWIPLIADKELWTSELSFHAKENREDPLWTLSINYSNFHVRTVRDHGGQCLPKILAKTQIVWISDLERESWTLNRKKRALKSHMWVFCFLTTSWNSGELEESRIEMVNLRSPLSTVVMIPNSRTTLVGSFCTNG